MTKLVEAQEILAKLEALSTEVAKFIAKEKASTSARKELITKAREDVASLPEYHPLTRTQFYVNEDKGLVVAKIVGKSSGTVYKTGIARLSKGDKFDAYIGKAIALRRALGKDVPQEYINAPQK